MVPTVKREGAGARGGMLVYFMSPWPPYLYHSSIIDESSSPFHPYHTNSSTRSVHGGSLIQWVLKKHINMKVIINDDWIWGRVVCFIWRELKYRCFYQYSVTSNPSLTSWPTCEVWPGEGAYRPMCIDRHRLLLTLSSPLSTITHTSSPYLLCVKNMIVIMRL